MSAFFYEQFYKWVPPDQKLVKEIIEILNGTNTCSVCLLDAGCGAGILSGEPARKGYFVIQRRKAKIYHCWDEKGISGLLNSNGFKFKRLQKSCLAKSHLLLCPVKER